MAYVLKYKVEVPGTVYEKRFCNEQELTKHLRGMWQKMTTWFCVEDEASQKPIYDSGAKEQAGPDWITRTIEREKYEAAYFYTHRADRLISRAVSNIDAACNISESKNLRGQWVDLAKTAWEIRRYSDYMQDKAIEAGAAVPFWYEAQNQKWEQVQDKAVNLTIEVKRWIRNNEAQAIYWRTAAKEAADADELAGRLQNEITKSAPELEPGAYMKLLGYALVLVNWRAIAEYLMED